MESYDCIVLGAGASGLMAAWQAAKTGASVMLVDKADKAGTKVRVAGGGKGNVTNLAVDVSWYIGEHPEFCRHVLGRFGSRAALDMLRALRIPLEEREAGQIFCLTPASRLVEALLEQGARAGVTLRLGQTVTGLEQWNDAFLVHLECPGGVERVRAGTVILALGSPAWPQIGASDHGHRLAGALGHRIAPVRPVLSPFVMPQSWPLMGLSGISLPVRLRVAERAFERDLLFTHKGISGPAALLASCFWHGGTDLCIDFMPSQAVQALMHDPAHGKLLVRRLVQRHMPDRLAERLIPEDLHNRKVAEIGKRDRGRLAACLHEHRVVPTRVEGLGKAEAAAGGVDTCDINAKSLESRLVPGLFLCGEVMDVTGLLGGYNLHWAWASGHTAGIAAARRAVKNRSGS